MAVARLMEKMPFLTAGPRKALLPGPVTREGVSPADKSTKEGESQIAKEENPSRIGEHRDANPNEGQSTASDATHSTH